MKHKPVPTEEELRLVHVGLRARMTVNAFHHASHIHIRAGTVLKQKGLVEDRADAEEAPAEFLSIVSDPSHAKRVESPPGPLVFYEDGEPPRRSAVFMDMFLLNPDPALRHSSIEHFARLKGVADPVLTPRSEAAIEQAAARAESSDESAWVPAAISIYDALSEDILLALAGFTQSSRLLYQAGVNSFLQALLHPTIESLEAVRIEVVTPSTQSQDIVTITTRCIDESSEPELAWDCYYRKLGHLPIDPAIGLARIARHWKDSLGIDELWERFWTWAARKQSPLASVQACLVVLSDPSLVPEKEAPRLQDIFRTHIGNLSERQEADEPLAGIEWSVRCDLARHYTYFLECQLPGFESERIANLAWWLAERVATAFGRNVGHLKLVHDQVVEPLLATSQQAWSVVRPATSPSLLQFGTLFVPSIWKLSLLYRSRVLATARTEDSASPGRREDVAKAVLERLLGSFPPLHIETDNPPVYAFDDTLLDAAEAWAATESGIDEKGATMQLINLYRTSRDDNELRKKCEALRTCSLADQLYICGLLKVLAFSGALSEELAWQFVSNGGWLKEMAVRLDQHALEHLLDVLLELQNQTGGRLASSLTHFLASIVLLRELENERRRLLFAFTIISAISCGTTGPVERILRSELRPELDEEIDRWCAICGSIMDQGLPWPQSRVRPVLALLRRWQDAPPGMVRKIEDFNPEASINENENQPVERTA